MYFITLFVNLEYSQLSIMNGSCAGNMDRHTVYDLVVNMLNIKTVEHTDICALPTSCKKKLIFLKIAQHTK